MGGYFWTCRILEKAKADPSLKNKSGFCASGGLNGEIVMDFTSSISDASSTDQLKEAFDIVEENKEKIVKSAFIAACLTKKRMIKKDDECKCEWSDDLDGRFKAIAKMLKDST